MSKNNISSLYLNKKTLDELIRENKGLKLIKIKKDAKKLRKVFYSLFNEEARFQLTTYDKAINNNLKKIKEEAGWVLLDRKTLVYNKDNINYEVKRNNYCFKPVTSECNEKYLKETNFCHSYIFKLRDLAMDLISEETYVKHALKNNLNRRKDYYLGLQIAIFLGLIEKEKNEEKTLVK